jgi:DNA repair exonuclease SbcCD nuclease subunit
MLNLIWSSDWHFGLSTSEIDRTEEITKLGLDIAKYSVKLHKKGEEVVVVLGGDLFEKNNPGEELISAFIRVLNLWNRYKIPVYVMVGNHDAISDPNRKSCLTFVCRLQKGGYNINLIDNIKSIKYKLTDLGPLYFSFFPHITKAHLKGRLSKTTQQYIDTKAAKIIKRMPQGSQHYVFSHLNVREAMPGYEENLLKKSEVYFPECLIMDKESDGVLVPTVLQGHIHSSQVIDNINIIGSPLFCGFGEKEGEKYFAHVKIPTSLGEKESIDLIPTKCKKFLEIKLDFIDDPDLNPKKMLKKVDKDTIVKFDVIADDRTTVDYVKLREAFAKKADYVKPIVPKIIISKPKRNVKQRLNLAPKEAVKVFLRKNKPAKINRKFKLAKKIIEEVEISENL